MTTLREAAQAVLDRWDSPKWEWHQGPTAALMADLRAALAQQAEPVAWMIYTLDGKSVCVTDNPADFTDTHRALPLYTAPPQRKPLTEEEIRDLWSWAMTVEAERTATTQQHAFARAIERAHGIE